MYYGEADNPMFLISFDDDSNSDIELNVGFVNGRTVTCRAEYYPEEDDYDVTVEFKTEGDDWEGTDLDNVSVL